MIKDFIKLPNHEKGKVIEFINHLPNKETEEAMKEAKYPEKLESYSSAEELFEKLGV